MAPAPVSGAQLIFHLSGQAFGLPVSSIQEIVPLPLLTRPPTLPAVLAGFLSLSQTPTPVLRLDRLLGLPESAPGLYTPLVVLNLAESRLAVMVDSVSQVRPLAGVPVLPAGEEHSFNGCVEGLVTIDGHVVLLLCPERLLLEKEQQCLADLQDRERTRLRDLEEMSP